MSNLPDETVSIKIPLPLKVQLWWCGSGARQERVQCPECLGTLVVDMRLGNGETYTLDCACCTNGYEGPYGYVTRTVHEYTPAPFTAHRVRIDGDEFYYSESLPEASCYSSVEAKDLFRTKEECQARCAEKTAEYALAQEQYAVNALASKRKSLAFSVHYWRGVAAKLEKDLERAKARINRCKQPKTEGA